MISFLCDKCDSLIELDDDKAGTKHECLNCGDINRVPDPDNPDLEPTKTGTEDRAARAGFPPDHGPETRVSKVRRCWFRSRPFTFALSILALLSGLIGALWVEISDQSRSWDFLFAPLVLGSILLIGFWWIDRFTAALEITTKRTIMHRGFFSKSSSEVVHDNIRNIQVDQTFLQRLFKVGRVGISSSGQDGVEIQVNHLPDPDKLRETIDLYRPL